MQRGPGAPEVLVLRFATTLGLDGMFELSARSW